MRETKSIEMLQNLRMISLCLKESMIVLFLCNLKKIFKEIRELKQRKFSIKIDMFEWSSFVQSKFIRFNHIDLKVVVLKSITHLWLIDYNWLAMHAVCYSHLRERERERSAKKIQFINNQLQSMCAQFTWILSRNQNAIKCTICVCVRVLLTVCYYMKYIVLWNSLIIFHQNSSIDYYNR